MERDDGFRRREHERQGVLGDGDGIGTHRGPDGNAALPCRFDIDVVDAAAMLRNHAQTRRRRDHRRGDMPVADDDRHRIVLGGTGPGDHPPWAWCRRKRDRNRRAGHGLRREIGTVTRSAGLAMAGAFCFEFIGHRKGATEARQRLVHPGRSLRPARIASICRGLASCLARAAARNGFRLEARHRTSPSSSPTRDRPARSPCPRSRSAIHLARPILVGPAMMDARGEDRE